MRPTTNATKESKTGRDGKREHERQSGSNKTGIKAIDKRNGGGAHNWGNIEDDLKDYNESSQRSPPTQVNEKTLSMVQKKPVETNPKSSPLKKVKNSQLVNRNEYSPIITASGDGRRRSSRNKSKQAEPPNVGDVSSFPNLTK